MQVEVRTSRPMKYVAAIDGEEYVIGIDRSGQVTVNDEPRDVNLESIDGESVFSLLVGSRSYEVYVEAGGDGQALTVDGHRFEVQVADERSVRTGGQQGAREQAAGTPDPTRPLAGARQEGGPGAVTSPMTGVLIELLVEEGQNVEAGEGVAILEAMKTENVIRAPRSGVVGDVRATLGQALHQDEVIMHIHAGED